MKKNFLLIPLLVLAALALSGCDNPVPEKTLIEARKKAIDACIEQDGVPIFHGNSLRLQDCLKLTVQGADSE